MKKILFALVCILIAGPCFAASSMVATQHYLSQNKNIMVIKVVATAHTDGTFDNKVLNEAALSAGLSSLYDQEGFVLAHAWVVNSATDNHANAAVVTVTDSTGQVLVGTASGDTLTLSQSASGIAYLSVNRASSQRAITSNLIIAIADTGDAATVQTLYLLLRR